MKLQGIMFGRKRKRLPRLAGGAQEPNELLCAGAQYMAPQEAAIATKLAADWQKLSSRKFAAFARKL